MHASARAAPAQGLRTGALFPWLIGALVLVSRVPFLRPGYGLDPDAYRVILAARAIRSGEYAPSRLPGYPLHELASALLLPGGPRLVNGGTALMSALSAVALFQLAERLGLARARAALLALAFAFTPVVFQNSTISLDYLWSLCFALWATVQVVAGRPLLAGLLLGAAIGARLTAGALLLPLLVLDHTFVRSGRAWARALCLVSATAASAFTWFAPVLHTFGLAFLQYNEMPVSPERALARATSEIWGSLGLYAWCGVAAIALCAAPTLATTLRNRKMRVTLCASGLAVLLFGCAFALLPHEAGYLIPCVPFLLLAVALVLPTLAIGELACLLTLSCFVTLDADGLSLPGPVASDREARIAQNAAANRAIRALSLLPDKAVVVAGSRLPLLEVKLERGPPVPHLLIYLLQSEEELRGYLRQGYALYYLDRFVERRQRQHAGIALGDYGAQGLP